jgi:prenyltransferase beta subunit
MHLLIEDVHAASTTTNLSDWQVFETTVETDDVDLLRWLAARDMKGRGAS